jgi:hypothetical protein
MPTALPNKLRAQFRSRIDHLGLPGAEATKPVTFSTRRRRDRSPSASLRQASPCTTQMRASSRAASSVTSRPTLRRLSLLRRSSATAR